MASNDTIRIFRGEDVVIPFTMDPVEPITGWTIELTVNGFSAGLFTKPAAITDGPGGAFEFTVTKADTLTAEPRVHAYAVRRVDTGEERVIAAGMFDITAAVGEPAS